MPKPDARFTEQIVALVDPGTKRKIGAIADAVGVSAGVVIRAALRHGLGLTEREAQKGRLRDA